MNPIKVINFDPKSSHFHKHTHSLSASTELDEREVREARKNNGQVGKISPKIDLGSRRRQPLTGMGPLSLYSRIGTDRMWKETNNKMESR